MVLPGCWLTLFGPARSLPVGARLSLAVLVSPVVVTAQWYAMRMAGLPFAATAAILPLVNLPPALRLWRALKSCEVKDAAIAGTGVALPLAYLWLWMHEPLVRANWGHAWTHAGISYLLANGAL